MFQNSFLGHFTMAELNRTKYTLFDNSSSQQVRIELPLAGLKKLSLAKVVAANTT